MNAERWKQVDRIFHAALEREAGRRADFVDQACAGDETLRKEVQSLIASHERAGGFIETPAADLAAELLVENQTRLKGLTVGPYEIVSLLGAGGMGEVYLARDTRLGRRVALKLLPAQATLNEDRLHRFEREARAASALNHPHIITLHEVGHSDGAHFIVTEFIEGNTLRQQLDGARMKLREALDVAIQVGSALEAAHRVGIVHRDIKPENIMRRPDGLVKVLDFGLAKLTRTGLQAAGAEASIRPRTETESGLVIGTVTYMSPEQARGLPVDARSDIFSLGIVIYEMVAGRPPFSGTTTSDVIVSILEKDPPPLVQYAVEVPTEMEQIVKKALTKNLEGRYQSARDLLLDLRRLTRSLRLVTEQNAAETRESEEPATTTADGFRLNVSTDEPLIIRTHDVSSVRATSSAEYLVGEIRKHKRAAALGALALVIAVAGALLFLSTNKSKPVASSSAVKTIAVLPFRPLVSDSRNESLELGMADTLINKLSGIRELIVRPLSDVRRYIILDQGPIAAGRELGVNYVLEGNLQMEGNRTRATMRLLSMKDGSAVWTGKCDEQCSNVFELQDAIAERIAVALALKLSGEAETQLAKHYTESPEAYQFYTLGVAEPDRMKKVEYFERAIEIDPNYALAYRAIWGVYFTNGSKGLRVSKEERQKAERELLKAAQLDETL